MQASARALPSYSWGGRSGVGWWEVLELGELKKVGEGYDLDRVLERKKREASVRRKKRERCLPVPVHG
jgi:hypothetical protein